jgi:cell volume regulation protein A
MSLKAFFGLLGGMLVLAFVANRLFRHTRVPDVFILMATGVLLGPVLGWVNPARFEQVTHAFGTLAVILILFEGGLELDVRETFRDFPGGVVLGLLTYLFSFTVISLVAWWGMALPFPTALLVGGVLGCTSSAIVLPILQQLEVRQPVKVTLLLEASLGDVLAVLTVGVMLDVSARGGPALSRFGIGFFAEIVISLLLALVAGILWSRLLPYLSEQRFWHVLTFSVVLLLYAASEAAHGSGLIAVLGFGIVLANVPGVTRWLVRTTMGLEEPASEHHQQVLTFHAELAFLVRTFFFVLLGVVVKLAGLTKFVLPVLGILGAIFLARWLAIHGSRWAWRGFAPLEREVVLWILPRGLITAVLAIQVVEMRGSAYAWLPALAFAVILATNAMVVVGTIRARRFMNAPACAAPEPASLAPLSPAGGEGTAAQREIT